MTIPEFSPTQILTAGSPVNFIPGQFLNVAKAGLPVQMKSTDPDFGGEYEVKTKDGTRAFVDASCDPVRVGGTTP